MRIVVSGTHASGKSSLIADFVLRHPEFTVLPDPFELMDESHDAPTAASFAAQLRIAADRLTHEYPDEHLIAERGPLDFLAYLLALAELTGTALDDEMRERAESRIAQAHSTVDLLVVLPLTAGGPILAGAEEFLDLRDEMNRILLDLLDDPGLVGEHLRVVEIVGAPEQRRASLHALVSDARRAACAATASRGRERRTPHAE